jgi:hypothetical protein
LRRASGIGHVAANRSACITNAWEGREQSHRNRLVTVVCASSDK